MRICAMADCRVGGLPQCVNAPQLTLTRESCARIAAEGASCYPLLTMRCGNRICVAVAPSSKYSYRCIHETFHQLQACGCARSRRKAKRTPCRKTVEVAQKL